MGLFCRTTFPTAWKARSAVAVRRKTSAPAPRATVWQRGNAIAPSLEWRDRSACKPLQHYNGKALRLRISPSFFRGTSMRRFLRRGSNPASFSGFRNTLDLRRGISTFRRRPRRRSSVEKLMDERDFFAPYGPITAERRPEFQIVYESDVANGTARAGSSRRPSLCARSPTN